MLKDLDHLLSNEPLCFIYMSGFCNLVIQNSCLIVCCIDIVMILHVYGFIQEKKFHHFVCKHLLLAAGLLSCLVRYLI